MSNAISRVLYISYDGMTDPLGQSQVLPYVLGLSERGYHFDLISFEKPARMKVLGTSVLECLRNAGVQWHPLRYTKWPPILSTAWDVRRLLKRATELHKTRRFDVVHCRSYVSALAGLELNQKERVPFVFDMRGFWVDERVDGGLWHLDRPLYRALYRYAKRLEQKFLNQAAAIVCLTHAGALKLRAEMTALPPERIHVIPCAVDFDRFSLVTDEDRARARAKLGLADEEIVIVYLGSLGTWYLRDEMLACFAAIREVQPRARLLFLTPEDPATIRQRASELGVEPSVIVVRYVPYDHVPLLLGAANIGLCFIKPGTSKIGSSPTKLGEYFAKGLPAIANAGVGDVAEIVAQCNAGVVLETLTAETYQSAALQIQALLDLPSAVIRARAAELFDLRNALVHYDALYRVVLKGPAA